MNVQNLVKYQPTQKAISTRELEIVHLILSEYTSKEIAEQLFISRETVLSHRKNIMQKLKARNTAGLVRRAIECGVVQLSNISN